MAQSPQTFANHARYVPLYHGVLALLLMANLVHSVMRLATRFSGDAAADLAVALSLMLLFWYTRAFPVTVQDRVIRLEVRLRLQVLAPDLMPRFGQLAIGQVVALRFAGDAELPALARQVLDGKLTAPAEIKKAIRDWQPDQLRA